jgi:hypothetical protein
MYNDRDVDDTLSIQQIYRGPPASELFMCVRGLCFNLRERK